MDMRQYFYQRDFRRIKKCESCGQHYDGLYVESEKNGDSITDYYTPCRDCEKQDFEAQYRWRLHNLAIDNNRKLEQRSSGMTYGSPENFKDVALTFFSERNKYFAGQLDDYLSHLLCGGNDNACFYGQAGTGKTMAGYAICNELQFNLKYPKIITHPMLKKHILKSYDEKNNWHVVNHYGNADLLIIDEFGSFVQKENDKAWLFDILDIRYQRKIPTILILNTEEGDHIKKLQDDLGYRLYDRMHSSMKLIEFDGESFR